MKTLYTNRRTRKFININDNKNPRKKNQNKKAGKNLGTKQRLVWEKQHNILNKNLKKQLKKLEQIRDTNKKNYKKNLISKIQKNYYKKKFTKTYQIMIKKKEI